jgi:hypothetical protein
MSLSLSNIKNYKLNLTAKNITKSFWTKCMVQLLQVLEFWFLLMENCIAGTDYLFLRNNYPNRKGNTVNYTVHTALSNFSIVLNMHFLILHIL